MHHQSLILATPVRGPRAPVHPDRLYLDRHSSFVP